MKQLTCEMCGSTDLLKQDGIFVCQTCGMKYSAEEAKNLMVEIDNSKKMANLYERARKSIEVNDLEHAAEYFKEILDENPNDWEAYFYSYLGETTSFTNAQAASVVLKLGNTIPSAYDMALDINDIDETSKRFITITTLTTSRLVGIASTGAALLRKHEGGGMVNGKLYNSMRGMVVNTVCGCISSLDSLKKKIEEISKAHTEIDQENIKNCLLIIVRARYDVASWEFAASAFKKETLIKPELIKQFANELKELDPNFVIPEKAPTISDIVAQAKENAKASKANTNNKPNDVTSNDDLKKQLKRNVILGGVFVIVFWPVSIYFFSKAYKLNKNIKNK